MDHVHDELRRIEARLQNGPEPNEHAGLYAAQQALSWVLNPAMFGEPYRTIVGMSEGSTDYSAESRHSLSLDIQRRWDVEPLPPTHSYPERASNTYARPV
jgi:hypothetical protein